MQSACLQPCRQLIKIKLCRWEGRREGGRGAGVRWLVPYQYVFRNLGLLSFTLLSFFVPPKNHHAQIRAGKKGHWGKRRVHLEILGGAKEQSGGRTVGTVLLYYESSEVHARIKATVLYNSAQLFYSIRICSHFHSIVSLLYFTLSYTRQSTQLRNRGLDAFFPPFSMPFCFILVT